MGKGKRGGSPWLWLVLLLIVGGFVAFILFLDRGIVEQARNAPDPSRPEPGTGRGKPVFDFYRVLPDRKVEIPEVEVIESARPKPGAVQADPGRARYILQAGSFQARKDAERRKANLALLGMEARIAVAEVGGRTYYRVEIGPFASDGDFSRAERRLIENDIGFIRKAAR
jgi:cell division protein FtsN